MILDVPDPRALTWERWVAELVLQDPTIPYPPPEPRWAEWAAFVLLNTAIGLLKPPDPRYFSGWRPWAVRLREAALAAA